MQIAQIMENLEEDSKVGKRVRGDKVSLIQEIIDALQTLLTLAAYEDNDKAATRGDLEAARERAANKPTVSSGGSSGGANWNARVGEAIIGNLGRGEGGRFISAGNITAMMNQLEKENISPAMFTGMQDLLAGKEVSPAILEQLKAAGLATEDGKASSKTAHIIASMKTGDPDKLKGTLKETGKAPGKGKGGGKKPKEAPKPTKDEVTAKNIDETGAKLIEQKRMTQNQLNALKMFANGETVDNTLMKELIEAGIVSVNDDGYFAFTGSGEKFFGALEKADLRKALDELTKARQEYLDSQEEEAKNFEDDSNNFCFGFKVLQNGYILSWTTNAYEDRERETFTLKSIEDYVSRNLENDEKGTYQFWHIPGSDFADILWQGVAGKFLVEIGKFREDEIGNVFRKFFTDNPEGHKELAPIGWGTSHGFVYKKYDREDGVYEWFDKQETTVLPLQEAANIYTLAEFMLGEKAMELSEKQIEAVNKIGAEVGMPSLLDKILGMGKKRTAILDGAGISSKQAVMKTEDGKDYPASCYAYVPDPEAVNTWKLRMCAVGTTEITREQLGAAAAALSPGGFRGNKVELPSEDVDKVKAKLRSEYSKLDVAREDMPESIKSLEVEVKDVKVKFAEATKACAADLRKKMDDVLSEMEKEDSDKVAMVRQLAELVAQVTEEELRVQLEELVNAMMEMLKPTEEEAPTEETPTEEAPDTEEVGVEAIAKALKLNELSELLENQTKAIAESAEKIKAFETVVNAIQELVEKDKALYEKLEALESEVKALKAGAVELAKEDEVKVAEKQARYTPFWASNFQASKAAETVLSGTEQKKLSKPEVPSVIQSMSKKVFGGK